MLENLIKCLSYYIAITSCVGLLFLIRIKKKESVPFLVIILFSMIWRSFSIGNSSRYWAILIFYGIFLSEYAVIHLSKIKSAKIKSALAQINIAAILSTQILKTFSGFNDAYVFDLQETIDRIAKRNDHSNVYVFKKEAERLLNNTPFDKEKPIDPINENFDLTDFYSKNSFYPYNLYYVNGESIDTIIPSTSKEQRIWKKTVKCNTGRTHKKFISIYKHFIPSPAISLDFLSGDLIPKAYVYEYDAFIYQENNKIVWVVGKELDDNTEVIFHIYPTRNDFLPEYRQKYGFDNRGFSAGKKEKRIVGKYCIYTKELPDYPVLKVQCGFNNSSGTVRTSFFTVSE